MTTYHRSFFLKTRVSMQSESAPDRLLAAATHESVRFNYRRKFGPPGICHVRVFVGVGNNGDPAQHVVLITESAENHGPSVTAAAELIATDVLRAHHLEPAFTTFVEHYDDRSWVTARRGHRNSDGLRRRDGQEDFDRIRFDVLIDDRGLPFCVEPRWEPIRKREVERLIGGALP
jgi:hypothetical protein